MHLRLLKALEHKCALDEDSGSCVVSSQAIMPESWTLWHQVELCKSIGVSTLDVFEGVEISTLDM